MDGYRKICTSNDPVLKRFLNIIDLLEGSEIELWHGDNFKTTKLQAKFMNNGNNQEGIGIYFGDDIEIAQDYGNDIIKIVLDKKYIKNSDDSLQKAKVKIMPFLKLAWKAQLEDFFYYMSDYIEVSEPDDITYDNLMELEKFLKDEQVQNFQIDFAEILGVEKFVALWNKTNKHIKALRGNGDIRFYAVIDTSIPVELK